MDYFQGVVAEYLRANRATFVNPECLVQIDDNTIIPQKNGHWYIDLLAVNMEERAIYLCEVSYSTTLASLLKKLFAWGANWSAIVEGLHRHSHLPENWPVRPWLFVPETAIKRLVDRMPVTLSTPKITPLEMTEPWRYCGWNRITEAKKPEAIPVGMR